jgi:hypothetical protein
MSTYNILLQVHCSESRNVYESGSWAGNTRMRMNEVIKSGHTKASLRPQFWAGFDVYVSPSGTVFINRFRGARAHRFTFRGSLRGH